jgi:hypothetical protein
MTNRGNPHDFESELNYEQLIRVLSYDPATGEFRWLRTRSGVSDITIPAGKTNKKGYRVITINQRSYYAHRLVWLYMTAAWPVDLVDHIDGDPSNNRWDNLRAATRAQNNANRIATPGESGVVGVHWHKQRKRWTARISHNDRLVYLGLFDTVEEAKAARDAFEREHRGDFTSRESSSGRTT